MTELASESLDGFAPSSGIEIRVSGSRTVGLFVLPAAGTFDVAVVTASLSDSAAREGRDFARVSGVLVTTERPAFAADPVVISAEDRKRFSEMELDGATSPDLAAASAHWLVVQADVATYTPGSTVYLVVTSSPLVIGSARVSADGTARITGAAPLDLIGGGAHRLRVVGSRDFGTVTVGAEGALQIPPATLADIQQFDRETTAVVEIVGLKSDGGRRELVRYIPLHDEPPYWLLTFPAALGVMGAYLRRRDLLVARSSVLGFGTALVLCAAAMAWIAWTRQYVWIAGASVAIGLLGELLLLAIRPLGPVRARPADRRASVERRRAAERARTDRRVLPDRRSGTSAAVFPNLGRRATDRMGAGA